MESLSNVTVTGVACGAFHSLAVTSSGTLYEWGLIHTDPDLRWRKVRRAQMMRFQELHGAHQNKSKRKVCSKTDALLRWSFGEPERTECYVTVLDNQIVVQ